MCRIMSQSEKQENSKRINWSGKFFRSFAFPLAPTLWDARKKEWKSAKRLPYSWRSDSLQCSPVNCPIKHNFLQMAPTKIGRKCVLLIVILLLAGPSLVSTRGVRLHRYADPLAGSIQQPRSAVRAAKSCPLPGCRMSPVQQRREKGAKASFRGRFGSAFPSTCIGGFGY